MTAYVALPGAGYSETSDIVLVLGDSEAGQGGAHTDWPDFHPPANGTLYMVGPSNLNLKQELSESCSAQTTSWSLGGVLAGYMQRQTGRKTTVCHCAVSGTDSTYFKSANAGYTRVVSSLTTALRTPGAQIVAIVIYGGANDGSIGSPAWDANWTTALSDIRSAIPAAASTPVWYVKLPPGPPSAPYNTSWSTVRTQQDGWATASAPARTMITGLDAWSWSTPTYVHLAGLGVIQVAEVIATAINGALVASPEQLLTTGLLHDWDAGVEVTQSSNAVSAWGNAVGTDSFVQATAGNKPTYAAASGSWNNRDIITFDGSNDFMLSDLASTSWDWLTNGLSDVTMYLVWNASTNADLLNTNNSNGSAGMQLRHDSGGLLKLYINRTSGYGNAWFPTQVQQSIPFGRNNFVTVQWSPSLNQARIRRDGSTWSVYTGNVGYTFPTNCASTLRLGNAFYNTNGPAPRILIYNRYHSTAEANLVGSYLKNLYGLPGRYG